MKTIPARLVLIGYAIAVVWISAQNTRRTIEPVTWLNLLIATLAAAALWLATRPQK